MTSQVGAAGAPKSLGDEVQTVRGGVVATIRPGLDAELAAMIHDEVTRDC